MSNVNDDRTGKVNCTIPLQETQIEVLSIDYEGTWVEVPAKITMRLSVAPQVFIEITIPGMPLVLMNSLMNYGETLRLRLPSGPEIEASVREWGMDKDKGWRSLLVPARQPATVIQAGENLQSVKFNLINFPSLNYNSVLLKAEPWQIEIKPLPELSEIKKRLKIEGGHALTHEGFIRRLDGKAFSVEEGHKLLDVLYLFLSFARGGDCGVTLIAGDDENGRQAWEQWGTYSTYPWFHLSSWLDHRHDNHVALSEAFPGFLRVVGQMTYAPDDPVRVALYWYLRSNESSALQAGIILTQAALERLARQLLPMEKYKPSDNAAGRIRAVLKETGIDPIIPQCCKELRAVVPIGSLYDGPEILTKIRNDLVHAEMRTNVSLEAYLEARDLGQWYVELLLLKLFGYEGQYANRIAYTYESIWEPELVPWTRDIKETG